MGHVHFSHNKQSPCVTKPIHKILHKYTKIKVKVSLEQATKAQRGSRCIALLFLQPRR